MPDIIDTDAPGFHRFPPYPKINSLYKRYREGPLKNKVIVGDYADETIACLADAQWTWTEKVDGTNVRLGWDQAFRPEDAVAYVYGRTDNAQFPNDLLKVLTQTLVDRADLLADTFNEGVAVTMYGEGYGAGVQKGGGLYRPDKGFVLFDILITTLSTGQRTWLLRPAVEDIAAKLGLDIVQTVFQGTIPEAVEAVHDRTWKSAWPDVAVPEGLVGIPIAGILDRRGHRIATKVKDADVGPDA